MHKMQLRKLWCIIHTRTSLSSHINYSNYLLSRSYLEITKQTFTKLEYISGLCRILTGTHPLNCRNRKINVNKSLWKAKFFFYYRQLFIKLVSYHIYIYIYMHPLERLYMTKYMLLQYKHSGTVYRPGHLRLSGINYLYVTWYYSYGVIHV